MQKSWTLKPTVKSIRILILVTLAMGAGGPAGADSGTDLFPRFASIEPNVEFWISIYSRYSTRQGVLHDSRRLDVVYAILELENVDTTAGRRVNRRRIRAAKKKYTAILRTLASGSKTDDPQLERVAALFGPGTAAAEYGRAAGRIRCQVGQRDRFQAGLIRSGAYLETIRGIFRSADLPEDLAFLPHVESSFNPKAYSKFGAAGIWQFTRSTGRRYMQVDYTVDERRDPILASRAAARLLKHNYEKLGSWPLAITAYNHGAAGMQRARRAHGGYEAIFRQYRSRTFKFASRNFYSEFLAAREVAGNYRRYFAPLPFDPPLQRTEVRLQAYAPAAELASHLDLDLTILRNLNPALRDPVFEGRKHIPKGYQLQLPAGNPHWPSLLAAVPASVFRNTQLPSRFHTVRRGETAGKIARRYGVRLDELIAANGLGPRATIYVNQNLRLPVAEEASGATPATIASATASSGPEGPLPPSTASSAESPPDSEPSRAAEPAPKKIPPAGADEERAVESRQVDRLAKSGEIEAADERSTMAEATPTEVGTLAADEPWVSALRPESSPVAPADSDPARSRTAVVAAELPPAADLVTGHLAVIETRQGKEGPVGIIQVEAEETLGHYAEWLKVRAWDIRKINGFPYGRMIHLGQRIQIPLHRADRRWFEQQRYEYHKEMVEDFFSAFRVETLEAYSVRKGDSIWVLSRDRFELPIWLIRRYNNVVDLHRLMPADQLRIPVVEEII